MAGDHKIRPVVQITADISCAFFFVEGVSGKEDRMTAQQVNALFKSDPRPDACGREEEDHTFPLRKPWYFPELISSAIRNISYTSSGFRSVKCTKFFICRASFLNKS